MIQHVTREIPFSALDQCVEFYSLLGFSRVPVPESIGDRAVWLEPTGTAARPLAQPSGAGTQAVVQLHLMLNPDAGPALGHVAFVLDDYEATLERLRAAGHDVEPRREHWGAPRAYVRDPASNLVEVMAWGPGER